MPGRYEPIDLLLSDIRAAAVSQIVCLVSDAEIAAKSPDYLALIERGEVPVPITRLSIPDYGTPEDRDELTAMLTTIQGRLDAGDSVVVHCAAGIGRTGMMAILLLRTMGVSDESARELVRSAGSAPENAAQRALIQEWRDSL